MGKLIKVFTMDSFCPILGLLAYGYFPLLDAFVVCDDSTEMTIAGD
jgi:hypothetical protein